VVSNSQEFLFPVISIFFMRVRLHEALKCIVQGFNSRACWNKQ
jgi:hypothetical protein